MCTGRPTCSEESGTSARAGAGASGHDVAVRAGRRVAEAVTEALEDRVGDRCGELVRLMVGGHPIQTEHLGQPHHKDTVTSHDVARHLLAERGQSHPVGRVDHRQAVTLQAAQRLARARRAHSEPLGELAGADLLALMLEVPGWLEVAGPGSLSPRATGSAVASADLARRRHRRAGA